MTRQQSPVQDEDGERPIDMEKARRGARLLFEAVGEDPTDDRIQESWQRRILGALTELTRGYRSECKPELRTFQANSDDLVVKTGIPVYSLCEHHLLPFYGTVHVAYRPEGAVVGLSKLSRYVQWQSRQFTIQERLTDDIASGLATKIGTETVMTRMEAVHLYVAMRGIEVESATHTAATVGTPTDDERDTFQEAIRTEGA